MAFKAGDIVIDINSNAGIVSEVSRHEIHIKILRISLSTIHRSFYANSEGFFIVCSPGQLSLVETEFERIMYGLKDKI